MWNRSEVKAKGKTNFKKNYWKSVLVAIIYSLFFVATGSATSNNSEDLSEALANNPDAGSIIAAVLAILGVLIAIAIVIDIFVLNPLEVGCNSFFLVNQDSDAGLGELGCAYKNNYGKVVVGILLRNLLITLGFIVLIPGLILMYSYRMVPYILAEDTQISGTDALKKSRAMMKGQKWKAFVFDLSYIGWYILSGLTCGILAIFYVNPYKFNADAALYQAIKGNN